MSFNEMNTIENTLRDHYNGLPLMDFEVRTPVQDAISMQDGAADFSGLDCL